MPRIFYTIAGLTASPFPNNSLDTDANGAPVGLTFEVVVTAQASGTGTIRVVLSHFDEQPKGDGSTPSDETDADVTFSANSDLTLVTRVKEADGGRTCWAW